MSDTLKAGVIGHPIKHSKSPQIHGYWIRRYDIKASYEAIDIAPDDLARRVKELAAEGYRGFNVTVPHKQAIMALCDEVDALARKVGAVNTVVVREDGTLFGTNTDVFGFIENLKQAERQFGYSWNIAHGRAVVLGAGGAARAVVQGLIDEGVPEILIANRTFEKAQGLETLGLETLGPATVRAIPWEEREAVLDAANLLVNTTALGMDGQPALEMDLSSCHEDAVVCDIVYAPLYTELLKEARAHDLRIVTGIGMLLHQARPAFESWFDILPEVTEDLEDRVLS